MFRNTATLALLLTLAVPALAAGMEPEHIAKLRNVAEAVPSPDGKLTAYVLSVPRDPFSEEDGEAWGELHVVDAEGNSRPFVTGKVKVSRLAWTPDGRSIAYLAKRGDDEHKSLYAIPVDGGESRRLAAHGEDIKAFSFGPEGKRIAFTAKEAEPEEQTELEDKGFDQVIFEEDWRPVRVWTYELGAESEPAALPLEGSAHAIEWGPTADRLAVALAPTPLVDDSYMRQRIHVVDPSAGKVVARLDNVGKLGDFRWSPDGKHLALISGIDINDPSPGRLMVASADGGAPRELLPDYPGHIRSLAWQDSSALVYAADVGVWTTIGKIDLVGEKRGTLIPKEGAILSDLELSADGSTAVFRGETPSHPTEVFRLSLGGGSPQRLTDSNPWLTDVELARQEVVRFAARDGLEIEGLLIHPLGAREGKRYPLVMIVHGGPEAHHRNGWQTSYSRPAQALAARGFAVFYTNYRGSTGRGVEFSKVSQADFAGKEFDDLVDAVDHLIARGLVDRDKVGITGGSYGGYATAWASTYYSERFAAGVMNVGISDLLSKVGTSDIPNELHSVHMRMYPWDDWQLMLDRSPIYHLDKARTPLLILHGKKDTRVHPGQSLELYRYLKIRNQAPVRLVLYPEEGHGNRRAAARYDYSLRLIRWMEHYLTGPGGDPPPYPLEYEGNEG